MRFSAINRCNAFPFIEVIYYCTGIRGLGAMTADTSSSVKARLQYSSTIRHPPPI